MTRQMRQCAPAGPTGLPLFDHFRRIPQPVGDVACRRDPVSAEKQARGRTGYHAGRAAEDIVASQYLRRGSSLAAQRFRGESGEIDLIFSEGETLVFVEVKHSRSFATAARRLSPRQAERITLTASEYLGTQPRGQLTDVRFDLALVDGQGAVRIVENAIMEGF